jgi:hypothetical protein
MVLTLCQRRRSLWCFWRSSNWLATGRIGHRLRVCNYVWVKSVFLFEGQTSKDNGIALFLFARALSIESSQPFRAVDPG